MPGNSYQPNYKKIFRFTFQFRYNSFEELLQKFNEREIEVMFRICSNNITITKYIPYIYMNDIGFLENIWCDYFLDCDRCHSGYTEIREYIDYDCMVGNTALNGRPELKYLNKKARKPQSGIFVKIEHKTNDTLSNICNKIVEYDVYAKIRRVQINDPDNFPELTI